MPVPDLNIIAIDDPHDARIKAYANQKDAWLKVSAQGGSGMPDGLFMAEGALVVRQLIASAYPVQSSLLAPARLEAMSQSLADLPEATPIYLAAQEVMDEIVGFPIHRGILAVGQRMKPLSLEQMLADAPAAVILEDLANHDNVGGIFRSVAALGGPKVPVFLSPRCCDPLYRKALRVSIGNALICPFATLDPWPEQLGLIKDAGFEILALTPDPQAQDLETLATDPPPRPAFLFGAEGPGLTNDALATADKLVRIPIWPGADSLNVGVAAAIALARLVRPSK